MKLVGSIGRQMVRPVTDPKLVHQIAVLGGWKHLPEPKMSNELECPLCQEKSHHTPLIDPKLGSERVWLCGNMSCVTYSKENRPVATTTPPIPKRAILWPLFCEICDVGNLYHDVQFEKIEQSQGKIDYLKKFASNPTGRILMQGDKGTGKTYCSLALCEFLSRSETSVIFMTQKQMQEKWLETFKNDKGSNFTQRLKECMLLVIDDFGTVDPSPGFMSFFMDIINTRMQWTKRGTVITTNMNDARLAEVCGDALSDRINTGQKFFFEGNTRRTKTVL